MSAAAPAVTPPPVSGKLDEFSDKLSPMLVKELRQGLRAKTFVILFLALQGLLAVVMLAAVGASSDGDAGMSVSKVIFFFFSLAALVAQPLRGVGSLHNEIKGNTIDLMVLTRLGSWRIVLGKWVAIVSQTALLLTAIIPYLILRYFFGRMDLFAELLLLALIFAGSAIFTAVTVGLSAIGSVLVRGLLPLAAAIYVGAGIMGITFGNDLDDVIEICSLQRDGSGWGVLTFLLVGGYLGWMALALGASMIAPMAENHSTSRRLIALGMLPLLVLFAWAGDFSREPLAVVLMLVAVPAIVIALTEPLQLLPPICRPFLKFGGLGKLAGRFLYPGWPSGVLFTGLFIAGVLGVFFSRPGGFGGHMGGFDIVGTIILMTCLGTLLLPALIMRAFVRQAKNPLGVYILVGVILCVIAIALGMIMSETKNDEYVWLFSWVPPVQMNLIDHLQSIHYNSMGSAGFSGSGSPDFQPVLLTGIVTSSVYFVLLLMLALRNFSTIREVEQEAENYAATTKP
ncbi:hypothetical protein OKA04_01130 [Luteolibacter flavescens]|uniref:ABC transporter permease n=1 Tax=Luteolibacter flavescens TaxID=1859460 RepID=A0ABT3FJ57_9BACT|nr:hypothetical protein [Luteolibacter flavescens]MCW1883311.1 hypothetical protein [Luteolibacter flavescens]